MPAAPTEPLVTKAQYDEATATAKDAAAAYYTTGDIVMDDATYDQLIRVLAHAEQAHPEWATPGSPTATVAAGAVTGDVAHTAPMLSLDNVFSPAELVEWCAALDKKLGRAASDFTIEPKMDGLAIAARYENGLLTRIVTRGDGTAGEDVTYAAAGIAGLPATLAEPVSIEARGEVLMTDAQFAAANEARIAHGDRPFVNARNGSAGALRGAKDRPYLIALTFFGYDAYQLPGGPDVEAMPHTAAMELLAGLGINTTALSTAGMGRVENIDQAAAWIEALGARRPDLGFGVDGAVVKANQPADRAEAGMSARAPRWAIAYKYPPDTRMSILHEVIWQIGRTGIITPRARIEPVFVSGTTIEYATLHNPADLKRKGFMIGDRVTVVRAGEVIPRLEAPVVNLRDGSQTPIDVPDVCPRCGGPIDRSQERWRCARGRECGLVETVRYAASRDAWDMEGLGDKLVTAIVAEHLASGLPDLFRLSVADLAGIDRMGETSAGKVIAEIEAAKAAPLARTLTALGIRGTGRAMSRRLAAHFETMAALRSATATDLMEVDGIGVEKADLIVSELAELADVIDELATLGVNMGQATAPPAAGSLPLAGATVVVSGGMTGRLAGRSRGEMAELIEKAGGRSSGSVSTKTTYLVTTETGTSKAVKAAELGIPVLTPDQFADLVEDLL